MSKFHFPPVPRMKNMEIYRRTEMDGKPFVVAYDKKGDSYFFECREDIHHNALVYRGKILGLFADPEKVKGETFLQHSNRLWSQQKQ